MHERDVQVDACTKPMIMPDTCLLHWAVLFRTFSPRHVKKIKLKKITGELQSWEAATVNMFIYFQGHLHSRLNSREVFNRVLVEWVWYREALVSGNALIYTALFCQIGFDYLHRRAPGTTGCVAGYLICIPVHQQRGSAQRGPGWTLQRHDG